MSHRHLEANTSKNKRHRHLRRERVVPEAQSLRCPWDPFLSLTPLPVSLPALPRHPQAPPRRSSPSAPLGQDHHLSPAPSQSPPVLIAPPHLRMTWPSQKPQFSGAKGSQNLALTYLKLASSLFKSSVKSQPGAPPLPAAPSPSPWSLAAIWASLLCSPKPHNPPTLGLPSLL